MKQPGSDLPNASNEFLAILREYETELAAQLERLLKELGVPQGAKILEIAAGTGSLILHLAGKGYKTTVADSSENKINEIKKYYDRNGLKGNFLLLDTFNAAREAIGSHDVVFVTETLDHYDGWEVLQVLEKMKDLGKYVIVLSQNPKCMPYLLYQKVAKERGDLRLGLAVLRSSFAGLGELAGLEVIKETYFSATSLSKWMAKMVSPETGELYADSLDQNLIPEDQRHFRVLVARAKAGEAKSEERISTYNKVYESELKALHRAYHTDVRALGKRISELDDEMVAKANSIRQLALVQESVKQMVDNPIGLLLSIYYERKDLQDAFPEVAEYDYRRLLKWAQETVQGKIHDYHAKKLLRFADWYGVKGANLFGMLDIGTKVDNPIGLLLSIYYERKDLQDAFPEVAEYDYRRLLKWAQETVQGKTHDANTDKLLRFADWYEKAARPLEEIIVNEKSDPFSVLLALYMTRRDLRNAFPEAVEHNYLRLLKWAQETVEGKTRDAHTDMLMRFADWYKKAPNDFENKQSSVVLEETVSMHLELARSSRALNRHAT